MKKLAIIITVCLISTLAMFSVYGLIDESVSDEWKARGTTEDKFFGDSATDHLYTVVVDDFEHGELWHARMSADQGMIKSKGFHGGPRPLRSYGNNGALYGPPEFLDKIDGSTDISSNVKTVPRYRKADGFLTGLKEYEVKDYVDKHRGILGVSVAFMRRGFNSFTVKPPKPTYLQGIVKAFDVWVCGRNRNHELHVIVEDIYGKTRFIKMGKLNFLGWRKLAISVPSNIPQEDFSLPRQRGLYFKGFMVKCDPMESYGKYFIYFDNVSAELSRYYEETFDPYDPVDNW